VPDVLDDDLDLTDDPTPEPHAPEPARQGVLRRRPGTVGAYVGLLF